MNRAMTIAALLFSAGTILAAAEPQVDAFAGISPEVYERMAAAPGARVAVWVGLVDRPLSDDPAAYQAYCREHRLPPVNEEYVRRVRAVPGVEYMGTSELTNEVGVMTDAAALAMLAALPEVWLIEPMAEETRERRPHFGLFGSGVDEYVPGYSPYQDTYYTPIDLRGLHDRCSGYDPFYRNGDTLGQHMKIAVLDDGIFPFHPAWWNTNIRLTPGDTVTRGHAVAAVDSFAYEVYVRPGASGDALVAKRSRDFGINWEIARPVWTGPVNTVDAAAVGNDVYIVGQTSGASGMQVYFWRSTDAGVTWQGPQDLTGYNPAVLQAQWEPRVAASGTSVYVTWGEREILTSEPWFWTRVRFRRSLSRGAAGTWDAMQEVQDTDTTLASGPDIGATAGAADVHVAWSQGEPDRLRCRSSTDRGETWGAVEGVGSASSIRPVKVAASGGFAHVVCMTDDGAGLRVYYYRPQGSIMTSLTTDSVPSRYGLDCAAAVRFVYVVWPGMSAGSQVMYMKRHSNFGDAGRAWDDGDEYDGNNNTERTLQVSISPAGTFISAPAVAAAESLAGHYETVHITWLDLRNDTAAAWIPEVYYSSNWKISAWRDFITPANLLPRKYGGHGTRVASAAAGALVARTNDDPDYYPYVGAAWQAELAIAAEQNSAQFIEAIKWADSLGADVINFSAGYGACDSGTHRTSQYVDWAVGRGIVFTKSAGNDGPGFRTVTIPGDNFNALTVGATLRNGSAVAGYSSRGPTQDGRIKPDVVVPGTDLYMADTGRVDFPFNFWSGTSYAAPTVAGAAALILQARAADGWTPGAVKKALVATARPVGGAGPPDSIQGWGIIRADTASKYDVDDFPPEILPTAIDVPLPCTTSRRVELWVQVREREQAPTVMVNLFPILGVDSLRVMSGTWVPGQWVTYRCTVDVAVGTPVGRKYLKVAAAGMLDEVNAYINLTVHLLGGVQEPGAHGPSRPVLYLTYPNPAPDRARVRFWLPARQQVMLRVYDVAGREVARLADGSLARGFHVRVWDGTDARGRSVADGVYLCRMETDGFTVTRKVVVQR